MLLQASKFSPRAAERAACYLLPTMTLGKRGWLKQVVEEAVAAHRFDRTSASFAAVAHLPTGPARARRYLRGILRETGLLYGTPAGRTPKLGSGQGPEETLFLAVLRTFCRIALDLAEVADAPRGPRALQVLALLAASARLLDEAEDTWKRQERGAAVADKTWHRVEVALEKRAPSLAADPTYGLVLHNGAVYAEATVFGRVAIAVFASGRFPREAVERRLDFAARQKAVLVKTMVGLVCAERRPGFSTRRAVLRQIDDLKLPPALADETRVFARKAFERPPSLRRTLREVKSRDVKRFIVEQTLLASLVDGRRSEREVEWTRELGAHLGFGPEALQVVELEMADFYARHRDVVDVFTLSEGAELLGEEWVDAMSAAVGKNSRAVLTELKETGELSVLLARAARGKKLSPEEKRRAREQLLDVAKAVPALALFTAPGGWLLLLALGRFLPPDFLPSAFREAKEEDDDAPPPSRSARH